ncbi:MAG: putative lipid II flippase FtsW [Candidatus Nealsonbacteria bacterium]|nr:putative lipid II flippase FtsW [Candidatus Nealsonbacteria bacterium]
MNQARKGHPDYILSSVVVILILLGIVILASVSAPISQDKFGSPNFYLLRYLLFGMLPGIFLGFMAYKFSLAIWKKLSAMLLMANLFLMALVFLPGVGIQHGGAARWINLGFTSLQPSEFLKLTFILYLANWLPSLKEKHRKNFSKTLAGFLTIAGLVTLFLALQKDVSTLGIIITSGILIYFMSGTPVKHTLGIIAGGLSMLAFLIKIEPYRLERIRVFLNPAINPMETGYQIKQALIAIGSGGILGKGLGMSLQKLGFLPEPMSDSIFAIFSEEAGFIGGLVVIALFLIFAWRGFKVVKVARDNFYKLASLGITFWITIQAFINIGATIGILPLTGIPLPFISYGGSAAVAELIGIGILLNISKHSQA